VEANIPKVFKQYQPTLFIECNWFWHSNSPAMKMTANLPSGYSLFQTQGAILIWQDTDYSRGVTQLQAVKYPLRAVACEVGYIHNTLPISLLFLIQQFVSKDDYLIFLFFHTG
jgi:hypothetical protein